jgi:drug/metabolite transporter (DMT)-like permease
LTTADKPRRVEIVLIAVVTLWGINTPVMKIGLNAIDPLAYNAFRLVIAALLTGAALVASGTWRPMPARDLRRLAAISFFGFFTNQIFIIYGMDATTAGNAALVLATLPVNVALVNRILGFEPLSPRIALGILLSLGGVILTVVGAGKEISLTGPHLHGAVLILLGQCGYAYYTVSFRRLADTYSLHQIMASVFAISALLFALISVPAVARTDWAAVPAAGWYSVVFSAAFALALCNFTWIWAVKAVGSTRASLYPNLCPIISILFAWLWLGEDFGLLQAAGAAVIFLGLWLARGPSRPSPSGGGD